MTRTTTRLTIVAGVWVALAHSGTARGAPPQPGTPSATTPSAAPPPTTPSPPAPKLAAPPPDEEPAPEAPPADPLTRIHDLEVALEQTRQLAVGRQPRVTVGGYIDLGFFATTGNGSGIVRDQGNVLFPQYAGQYGWVFLGDLLATTVNTRGEVADLGDPTGAPPRFDSIHNGGAPSFIANEVNMTLTSGLGESALATASVNFVPRSGSNFSLGDFLDVDLAQLEWLPTKDQRTSVFVGKFDSVIGIEYRERKSNQRFGITPSLIARYTTGTALGVKVRSKFGPDDLFVIAAAATNGSFTTEQFHFYEELSQHAAKTVSGRASLHPPLPVELELGVSGSWGTQDRSPLNTGAMWFWGVDLAMHLATVDVKAQYLRGGAPGEPQYDVYGLQLHNGGYAEIDWMITPLFGLLGRAELRDAFVWLGDPNAPGGANRAYLTKNWRGVGGLRIAFSDRVVLKAEYLHNGEYGNIPQIKDDVFTSSLVLID
jgi:hypothetical protein